MVVDLPTIIRDWTPEQQQEAFILLLRKWHEASDAQRQAALKGTPGRDVLPFAGSIPADDLKAMSAAIDAECGRVDPDA